MHSCSLDSVRTEENVAIIILGDEPILLEEDVYNALYYNTHASYALCRAVMQLFLMTCVYSTHIKANLNPINVCIAYISTFFVRGSATYTIRI